MTSPRVPEEPRANRFSNSATALKVILCLYSHLPMPIFSLSKRKTQEELISEPNKSGVEVKPPSLPRDVNCYWDKKQSLLFSLAPPPAAWQLWVKRGSQIFTEYEVHGGIGGFLPWVKCTKFHFSFLKAGQAGVLTLGFPRSPRHLWVELRSLGT